MRSWIRLAVQASILRRSLATAAVVRIILTLVNHGGEVLGGRLQPDQAWPIAFTFIVPFAVATISSVAVINGTEAGFSPGGPCRCKHPVASETRCCASTSVCQ